MINQPIIRACNLHKQYKRVRKYPSIRNDFGQWLQSFWMRKNKTRDMLTALNDISFEVTAGESVAIIGRNGAGKSTLLRILCGISQPTSGMVEVSRHFIAILSPQVGFIGPRSGRENIYLLAAMYGVKPQDIDKNLDSIIEFAELEDTIYDPVDHYSSGMRARLGFSIVIHIAPEILFVDEALAVGDIAFQNKCFTALHNLQARGRTLVFVTHAMDLARRLCTRAIWLEAGLQVIDGSSNEVVDLYENFIYEQANADNTG